MAQHDRARDALAERLCAEARRERPAFCTETHERLLTAVRRGGDATVTWERRRAGRGVALAACLLGGLSAAAWWGGHEGLDAAGDRTAAVADGVAAIERLPMYDEIRADVAGGVGSLAVTAIGLADWRNLPLADLAIASPADVGEW